MEKGTSREELRKKVALLCFVSISGIRGQEYAKEKMGARRKLKRRTCGTKGPFMSVDVLVSFVRAVGGVDCKQADRYPLSQFVWFDR